MSKQIIYTGNIIHLYKNPQKYLKKLLKLGKVEILYHNHVYRNNKRVIKILKYDQQQLLTCQLTAAASKLGIGAKYLGYDIIYHKKTYDITSMTPVCIYLYTEYGTPVNININKRLVNELAEKIVDSKLLFHPDFWYENLVLNKDNILVAIDWDGKLYNTKMENFKKFNLKTNKNKLLKNMLEIYQSMEERKS